MPDATGSRLADLLLAEAKDGAVGTQLMCQTLARALAAHILRHHSSRSPYLSAQPAALPRSRLRHVVEYMRAHLDGDMPLAKLAGISGLSPSHFARAFHLATGQAPHRYLIQLRIAKARDLLEHTELPVTEIAFCCGFRQPTHFATMFRRLVGMSPRAWRSMRWL